MRNGSCWPSNEGWRNYWPSGIVALIATIQLLVSFVILGIQICIVPIGLIALCNGVVPRYIMGFVCWAFFFACWISTFCVTCCNRSSVGCATYVLVKNVLAFIFSAVLIDFDRKFIENPGFDYTYTNTYSYTSNGYTTSCSPAQSDGGPDFLSISVSLTKGQLAGAVIILVTSLIYVGVYAYAYIRALIHDGRISSDRFSRGPHHSEMPRTITPGTAVPAKSSGRYTEPTADYSPVQSRSRGNPEPVLCHNCRTIIFTSDRF